VILYWKEENIKWPNQINKEGLVHEKFSNITRNKGVNSTPAKSNPVIYEKEVWLLNLLKRVNSQILATK
jgi:hypothetical protein